MNLLPLYVLQLLSVVSQETFGANDPIACGSTQPRILTDKNGEFTSPNHPAQYPANSNCSWQISSNSNEIIFLTFPFFELEGCDFILCTCDFVSIYDTNSADPNKLLGKVCGLSNPGNFTSEGNFMYIVFQSDGSNQFSGFKANYTTYLGTSTTTSGPTISTSATTITTSTAVTTHGYNTTSLPPLTTTATVVTTHGYNMTSLKPSTTTASIAKTPDIEVTVNGSFESEGNAMISEKCSNSYANEMNKKLQNMTSLINNLIGQQLCLGTELILSTGDSRWVKNPDNTTGTIELSVTMPGLESHSFFKHHHCAEEISEFLQNHDNWGTPILGRLPGCPFLLFQPRFFSDLYKMWQCST